MAEIENDDKAESSSDSFRQHQREQLKALRKKQSDELLSRIRGDVAVPDSNISVNEMKLLGPHLQQTKKKLDILRKIRSGLALGEEYVEAYISSIDGLHQLITALTSKDPEIQVEAAACLTNIAAYSHTFSKLVAKRAGSLLIASMLSSGLQLKSQCAWAAANVCNDCEKCFSILKKQSLLPMLTNLLESPHPDVIESATAAFLACTKYDDPDLNSLINSNALKLLISILKRHSSTPQCRINAMLCLSNVFSQIMESGCKDLQSDICEIALSYFIDSVSKKPSFDNAMATACVRCLGTLTAFCDNFCHCLSTDMIFGQCALNVLNCNYPYLKKEMLWVLSNILVSAPVFSDMCLDWKGIVICIKPFVCLLDNKAILALYLLCILVTKSDEYRTFVIECLSMQVQMLCHCGNRELETAANTLISLLVDHTTNMDV